MKKWSFRKKITVIFAALQVLGIGVGGAVDLNALLQRELEFLQADLVLHHGDFDECDPAARR